MIHYEPRGTAAETDLADLEQRLGRPLPEDYRIWLGETDGAGVDTLAVANGVVSELAGAHDTADGGGLAQVQANRVDGFGSWVPEQWLIVSRGSGGAICLKTKGEDPGSVWWADYDRAEEIAPRDEHQDAPLSEIMTRLGDSWRTWLTTYEEPPLDAEFLAMLESLPPER